MVSNTIYKLQLKISQYKRWSVLYIIAYTDIEIWRNKIDTH